MERLNPYSSSAINCAAERNENRIGKFGLCLSMCGMFTFFSWYLLYTMSVQLPKVAMPFIAICLMCSPLGVVVSIVSLIWAPRNLGIWGIVVGVLVSLYIPTLLIFMFRK